MAKKLGILSQALWGQWADRGAINKNAEDLSLVEADVTALRAMVQRQGQEIVQLRALVAGVIDVLQARISLGQAELERAVQEAMAELQPPPPPPPPAQSGGSPYRDGVAAPPDDPAAKALFAKAQDLHFGKWFDEARELYAQVAEQYPGTKQAQAARQQLENLKKA